MAFGFDTSNFYTGTDFGYSNNNPMSAWNYSTGGYLSNFNWSDVADVAKSAVGLFTDFAKGATPYIGLGTSIYEAGARKAAGYYQQGMYEVQALNTLTLAGIRADQEERISALQAGRRVKQAEIESRNYQIQSNNILRTLEKANATARARASANGIDAFSGSAQTVQNYNTKNAMFDVGVSDYNALMAKVLGYEDASAMLMAGMEQAKVTRMAADLQAKELRLAGDFAVKSGGLLSNVSLATGAGRFLSTV